MAAEFATLADTVLLRQRTEAQRASPPDKFLLCDLALHREIARIGNNPIFPAVIEAVFQWAGGYYQPLVRAPST